MSTRCEGCVFYREEKWLPECENCKRFFMTKAEEVDDQYEPYYDLLD